MFLYGEDFVDERRNDEVMQSLARNLRRRNAGRYGLKDKTPCYTLIRDTTMEERRTCLGYNLESLNGDIVLFTGQCLVKDYEDSDCPVTLEDALECERLRELLQKHPVAAICMYPDSTYRDFVEAWSGKQVDEKIVGRATEDYIAFRRHILPDMAHVRTSETEGFLAEMAGGLRHVERQIKRIYGGRVLTGDQPHPLQRTILEYGMKTVAIPLALGYADKDVVVFAEPDEICSVVAAEMVGAEIGSHTMFGLIGQIPLPSLSFPARGRIRMYSADREDRIHLSEKDETIRAKLEQDTDFCLLALYLSPLTTEDQLQYIGKSKRREIGIDILMGQINAFRTHLE